MFAPWFVWEGFNFLSTLPYIFQKVSSTTIHSHHHSRSLFGSRLPPEEGRRWW